MKSNSSKTLFLLLAILIIALVPAVMQAQAHFVSNLEPPSEATTSGATVTSSYAVVDTNQTACYDDNGTETACPIAGQAFYGQDAQHTGNVPSYTNNGNGTITDTITGLMWQKSPNTDGDSDIDADDKLSYDAAGTYCQNLTLANYTDWRLPDIKQLYSLIDFSGTDPSGYNGSDTSGLIPFIDTAYFDFAYGDTSAGERIIDSQYASETLYVADNLVFGVNFADGRIKGYDQIMPGPGNVEKTFFVICVRDNASYGVNDFVDNPSASSGQAATITDSATSLMWAQNDSAAGLNWEESLAWVQAQNDANYLGYDDWRLPDAKELQSLVDYGRSPDSTSSAAIDPLFNATAITNEAGQARNAATPRAATPPTDRLATAHRVMPSAFTTTSVCCATPRSHPPRQPPRQPAPPRRRQPAPQPFHLLSFSPWC